MSYFAFDHDDGLSKFKRNRRRNNNPYHTPTNTGAGMGTTYRLDATTSVDETEDGNGSLTYSASSSQAGESTDSSLGDLGVLLEKEHQHHLTHDQRMKHGGANGGNFPRDKSSGTDSLGYSEDDDLVDEKMNHASWNNTISG